MMMMMMMIVMMLMMTRMMMMISTGIQFYVFKPQGLNINLLKILVGKSSVLNNESA